MLAERLPLEGKLAAKPTDEVVSENQKKAGTSVKNAGFPPHPPHFVRHLPLQGKAEVPSVHGRVTVPVCSMLPTGPVMRA